MVQNQNNEWPHQPDHRDRSADCTSWCDGQSRANLSITADESNIGLLDALLTGWKACGANMSGTVRQLQDEAAFAFLINEKTSLALTAREITPVETVPYKKQRGTPPFAIKVAVSPCQASPVNSLSAAVYVHHSNPVTKLSVTDVRRIFTRGNPEGDCSHWKQLGVDVPPVADAIHPVLVAETSALGVYLDQHHFGGRERSHFCETTADSDTVMMRIGQDPSAIGIARLGRDNAQVRMVPLSEADGEGASAGDASDLQQQKYPLARYLYLYLPLGHDRKANKHAAEFAAFVLSNAGQSLVDHHARYLALGQAERQQQSERLSSSL